MGVLTGGGGWRGYGYPACPTHNYLIYKGVTLSQMKKISIFSPKLKYYFSLKNLQNIIKSQISIKKFLQNFWKSTNTLDIWYMDLTKINFHLHPKWQLIKSSPRRLIFKSPYINDEYAAVEIETEGDAIYGLIKSADNPIGNRVILGKGMPLELFLMLIVDVLAEDIFEYSED